MNSSEKPDQANGPRRSGLRSPLGWALTALLFLGASWLGSRTFESSPDSGSGANAVPTARPTTTAASAPSGHRRMVERTLYLPDDQGDLKAQKVQDEMTERAATTPSPIHAYEAEATRTVRLLMMRSPSDFPLHTRLLGVRVDGAKKIADVNFDKSFIDPKFWQGSTRTTATIGSLLKTLMSVKPTVIEKVQFLVEGKPVDTVGGYDLSDPLGATDSSGSTDSAGASGNAATSKSDGSSKTDASPVAEP